MFSGRYVSHKTQLVSCRRQLEACNSVVGTCDLCTAASSRKGYTFVKMHFPSLLSNNSLRNIKSVWLSCSGYSKEPTGNM